MYFARMCFEVVVFGLCIAGNGVKARRNSVPTRGFRLTNWQLLSAERGRVQGNWGNCIANASGRGRKCAAVRRMRWEGKKKWAIPV